MCVNVHLHLSTDMYLILFYVTIYLSIFPTIEISVYPSMYICIRYLRTSAFSYKYASIILCMYVYIYLSIYGNSSNDLRMKMNIPH